MTPDASIQRLAEALDGLIAAIYDLNDDDDTAWLRPLIDVRNDVYDLLCAGSPLNADDFADVCRETRRSLGNRADVPFGRRAVDAELKKRMK